jgi:cytochrome b561
VDKQGQLSPARYDGYTILLHWITALIVFLQFLSAEFWDEFPRSARHFLILCHMSCGFVLAVILIFRLAWRLTRGTTIAAAHSGMVERGARALHGLLYVLLAAQIPLGLFTRWTDNKPLDVFGLLIPSPLGACSKATGNLVDQIHDINAWIIMAVVGAHATAALLHHFLWRDGVLRRMLPAAAKF